MQKNLFSVFSVPDCLENIPHHFAMGNTAKRFHVALIVPIVSTLFFVSSIFFSAVSAQEDQQWSKMLQGLKNPEHPYYDTALDYLDWMRTSPLCPLTLKGQIDYQAALIHFDAVQNDAMFLQRDEHMKRCRELLEKFVKEKADNPLVFQAQSMLGRLFMEEGRIAMIRSEHETTRDEERGPLREKARGEFKKALPSFEAADKIATERAKKLQETQKANPNAVKDSDLFSAYGEFLIGKILINMAKMDIAKTYPKDSKEFKEGLTAVAKSFEDLSKKYSQYSAGFTAKLYAAKTYKELGDFKNARALLGELNVLQGPEYQDILTESLLLALDMNLIEKKPENYLDSINRARAWNENSPAVAKRTQEGQRIFLMGAENFIAYADTVKNNKSEYDKAIRDAGVFLRQIRPNPNFPQIGRRAQELLQQIGAIKIDKSAPANYEQAKEYAEEDWRAFTLAFTNFQNAKSNEKEAAKVQVAKAGDACVASFNKAINMREEGTPMTEINQIRQNLVTVYWFQGKLLEAALLADYLTQRYSGSPNAEKTAVMAVRLYRQIFVEDKLAGHDPTAVAARLSKLCDFILTRWEGQEVTGEVQLLQIETAIDNGDIAEAKKLLSQTAEGTPQRISAELKIGQSLWNRYASLSKLPEGADEKPEKKDQDELLADARKQLELGLNGKIKLIQENKVKVDAASVQCALALAQICLNANQADQAIKWLNDPQVGPLALSKSPPATVPTELFKGLRLPATMFALRAYVGTENLDKAEETMNDLEKLIKEQAAEGDAGAEEQRLTQIYVSLGRQLEDRLKALSDEGKIDQAEKVAKGFELFLIRIKDRGDANSFQSIYWVADTFYRLGSGMSTEKNVPAQAKSYYELALKTYADILKRTLNEEDWAPGKAEDTIKARMAESLRGMGQYETAMNVLKILLDDSDGRIDLQIEAAMNLEAWGKEDPTKMVRAVTGGFPSRKIWGWNGIIKRTSIDIDKYANVYYDAYLNKLRCFIELGRGEKDREKKQKYYDTAERDIRSLLLMRPQLGGPDWFVRFDQIYKSLERAKGNNRPAGLKTLLEQLGDEQPVVEAVADTASQFVDNESAKDEAKPKKKKTQDSAKAKTQKKQKSNNMPIIFGACAVGLCVPVIAFFAMRKKKRR